MKKSLSWAFAILVGLAFIGWCSQPAPTPTQAPSASPRTAAPSAAEPVLDLLQTSDSIEGGNAIVVGKFRNLTKTQVGPITVTVEWFTGGDFPLPSKRRKGYFELKPDEMKEFRFASPSESAMAKYSVRFTDANERAVAHRDSRKK